jgi:hypothetical protein
MALRKIVELEGKSTIKTSMGFVQNGTQRVSFSAYIKVISVNGDKNQVTADVNFLGEAHELNKQYQIPISVEFGSANFIAQVYIYLKKLPEFAGAIDC